MAPPTTTPYCPTHGRWRVGCNDRSGHPSSMRAFNSIGNFVADSARDTGRAIAATNRFLNKLDDNLGAVDEIVEGAACLAMSSVPPAAVACGSAVLLEQVDEEIEDRLD